MKMRATLLCVFLMTTLLPGRDAVAQVYRMVPDPTTNHYEALEEFLNTQGYWPEDIEQLLLPLDGVLDRDHGTNRVIFVQTLDDVPGLRPLPDGVVAFVHRRHNVIYVDIAEDRLLLGISKQVLRENGRTVSAEFHFETFDLIGGSVDDRAETPVRDSTAMVFFGAHGNQFPFVARILLGGMALMVFLAARVRRKSCAPGDPAVIRHRLTAARFGFRLAAFAWVLLLAAVYAFTHFAAHLQFLSIGTATENLSYSLIDRLVGRPDRLRMYSFLGSMSISIVTSLLLAAWAGLFRRIPRPEPRGGRS